MRVCFMHFIHVHMYVSICVMINERVNELDPIFLHNRNSE